MSRFRRIALLCVALVGVGATTAHATTRKTGYLSLADGTQLKYAVVLPDGPGPFPTVMTYDGYDSGVTGGSSTVGSAAQLAARGYAAFGVNVRGTGCSSGVFELFPPQWGVDGAAAVEWAAKQPWSTGKVAEIGHSFAGFVSWSVAAQHPPHLVALEPAVSAGDFYRDAVFPGGVYNTLLAEAFVAGQESNGLSGAVAAVAGGDTECAGNYAMHEAVEAPYTTTVVTLTHPFNDDFWRIRAPRQYFGKVDVPVLASNTWQDSIAGSGIFGHELSLVNPDKLWFVGGNGDHDLFDVTPDIQFRFLDHYLKGTDNGWQHEPHIRLWQDDALPTAKSDRVRPGWEVALPSWPLPVQSHELFLRAGHALSDTGPTVDSKPDSYAYPRLAASALTASDGIDQATWKLPFDPSGAIAYTTAPLDHDVVLAGPGSLDVWMSSTAASTDLQATLTEVRPDGQEAYLQRGWLRLSHRKLDPAQTTDLEPVPTSLQSDQKKLVPGRPTFARLRVFPFSHALRKGSRLRLIIDAPTSQTGVHGFLFDPTPSTDTIYHDAAHPSVLRLGVLAGQRAPKPLPACANDVGEPCRPDSFTTLGGGTDPVFVGTGTPILPAARACVSRRRIVVHLPKGTASARITVTGRSARTYGGRRATVDLRGLPRGRYRVSIVVRTRAHRTIRSTRTYRTCAGA